jgi:hypothetical protein
MLWRFYGTLMALFSGGNSKEEHNLADYKAAMF